MSKRPSDPIPKGKPRKAARPKPLRWKSEKRRADAEQEQAVRDLVFARDGHRCVLDRWQGKPVYEWVDAVPGEGPRVVTHTIPACGGRLDFGHRRKASAGGAYVPANGRTVCRSHNLWTEDEPDAARAAGGEEPWWLVAREGDPEWESLGRRANRT